MGGVAHAARARFTSTASAALPAQIFRWADVNETDVIVTIEGLCRPAHPQPGAKAWGFGSNVPHFCLLPVRADHGRCGSAQEEPQADRPGPSMKL